MRLSKLSYALHGLTITSGKRGETTGGTIVPPVVSVPAAAPPA